MKLKTEELRRFLSTASQIKPNPVALNLDSIKIECTGQEIIFYKTNQNIWVKYSYVCQPQMPETFLINERMLNGVAVTSKEYEITIETTGIDKVLITGGEDALTTTRQDLALFPQIQEAKGERVKVEKYIFERIRTAAKYIKNDVHRTIFNYVQIGVDGIFASNLSIVYYYKAFPLPELYLDHDVLTTIKATDDLFYWCSESFDFYQIEGFTFGFIKNTVKPFNYLQIVNQKGDQYFKIKRQDFIDFCTLVQYSKKQDSIDGRFKSVDKNTLQLCYLDADFNINILRHVNVDGNAEMQPFRFNVDQMEILLKSLPYQTLTFTRTTENHIAVTSDEDENYKGIIARLADPVQN